MRTALVCSRLALVAALVLACGAPPTGPGPAPAPRAGPDPDGPRELQTLARLAGHWEATFETTVVATGTRFQGRTESHVRWACDGRVLLDETTKDLGSYGRSSDLGLWSWDGASGNYRYWRFNSLGARETGSLRYEADEATFYLASETVSADGQTTQGAGTMHYLADDTKEYHWVALDPDGQTPLYEVRGTSRRLP